MTGRRIAFVVGRIGAVETQAIPLLSAIVRRRGHEAILVAWHGRRRRAIGELRRFAPDVIAYSIASNQAGEYLAINRELKRRLSFFALFGGPHVTFGKGILEDGGVDGACRGEGDTALPDFLDRFGTDAMYETSNFAFHTPDGFRCNPPAHLVEDLDTLPFPDRDLVFDRSPFLAQNPVKGFMAGRGCPYNCAYCFNHAFHALYKGKGRILRTKSVSYLIEEIQGVRNRYPMAFIRFYDDLFGADPEWLEEFAQRFPKEIGLPFSANARPNIVTGEYAQRLKRAGCFSVFTAVECGNERLRNDVLDRHISNQEILDSCDRFRQAGIRIVSLNMLGVPGETEDDIRETMALNRTMGADFADASIFQPYPGTRAERYCRERGLLDENHRQFESTYVASALNISPEMRQRIFMLHKFFGMTVRRPWLWPVVNRLPKNPLFNPLWTVLYRLHYAFSLHRNAYNSVIPFRVRLRGAYDIIFSRNRI